MAMDLETLKKTATAVESIKHFCLRELEKSKTSPQSPPMQVEESYLISKIAEALGELVSNDFTNTPSWAALAEWAAVGVNYSRRYGEKTDTPPNPEYNPAPVTDPTQQSI